MVPSVFIFLDQLPLTPNGKVDRRALPGPEGTRPQMKTAFIAPRTPVEQAIADIWQEVLGVEQVGIHDNFFDLGGHSLLATQVVARLAAEYGITVSLSRLFETPTIADLALEVIRHLADKLSE
jgi:acyl carrier protein